MRTTYGQLINITRGGHRSSARAHMQLHVQLHARSLLFAKMHGHCQRTQLHTRLQLRTDGSQTHQHHTRSRRQMQLHARTY